MQALREQLAVPIQYVNEIHVNMGIRVGTVLGWARC